MRWLMLLLASSLISACGNEGRNENGPSSIASVDLPGQALASACSGCHAIGGVAITDLSGWPSESIAASMMSYKNDPDGTTVMHRLASGYSDEEISQISEYLSAEVDVAE